MNLPLSVSAAMPAEEAEHTSMDELVSNLRLVQCHLDGTHEASARVYVLRKAIRTGQ